MQTSSRLCNNSLSLTDLVAAWRPGAKDADVVEVFAKLKRPPALQISCGDKESSRQRVDLSDYGNLPGASGDEENQQLQARTGIRIRQC